MYRDKIEVICQIRILPRFLNNGTVGICELQGYNSEYA